MVQIMHNAQTELLGITEQSVGYKMSPTGHKLSTCVINGKLGFSRRFVSTIVESSLYSES